MIDKYFIPDDQNDVIVFDTKTSLPSKRAYTNNVEDILRLENILEYLNKDILKLLDINSSYEVKYFRNKYINRWLKRMSTINIILIVVLVLFNGLAQGSILSIELIALLFSYITSIVASIIINPSKIKKKIEDINKLIDIESSEREEIINKIEVLKKEKIKTDNKGILTNINYVKDLNKEQDKINNLYSNKKISYQKRKKSNGKPAILITMAALLVAAGISAPKVIERVNYANDLEKAGDTTHSEFEKLVMASSYNDGTYNYISFSQYCTVNGFTDSEKNPSGLEFRKFAKDELVKSYRNGTIDNIMTQVIDESRGK